MAKRDEGPVPGGSVRRWEVAFLLAVAGALFLAYLACEREMTVYLVRHAEKGLDVGEDPPLTEAGQARANALREALGRAGVDAIYVSDLRRTADTARPLAEALGIEPRVFSIRSPANRDSFVASIADELEWGDDTVVVGHSTTIPLLANALGVDEIAEIDEDTGYDHIFVITVPRFFGQPTVAHVRYGAPPVATAHVAALRP